MMGAGSAMTIFLWGGFLVFVLLMLAADLGIINRRSRVVGVRQAVIWTCVCIALALAFNVLVYFIYEYHWMGADLPGASLLGPGPPRPEGRDAAQQFFAGWLVEYSLSLDNIFVMAIIFRYFRVPAEQQHRVLFWGILGALIMRGAMIAAGTALIRAFSWTQYIFGAFLIITAVRMLFAGDEHPDPDRSWVVRTARKIIPVAPTGGEGTRFFTRVDGRLMATPLFIVLLTIEATDVVFAVDSIPAILGITQEPFIVFTSNVFAILGLRSLYSALAAIIDKFRYLKTSLVFVLGFVGLKMVVPPLHHLSTTISLTTIALILCVGLVASAVASRRERLHRQAPIDDLAEAAELAWRRSRKIVILVLGLTLVLIIAPVVGLLPGPGGIAVAVGGLALLATEFVWARNLLKGLKAKAQGLAEVAVGKRPRLWLIPVVFAALGLVIGVVILVRPQWTRLVLLASIGPTLAVLFWAYVAVKRWRDLKRAAAAGGAGGTSAESASRRQG